MLLQIFEVAPSLHMVELRKTGGDTLEFHKVLDFVASYELSGITIKWLTTYVVDYLIGKCMFKYVACGCRLVLENNL